MTDQPNQNDATDAQARVNTFYARANAMAAGQMESLAAAGAPPQMIPIAASLMISHALKEIVAHDRDGAKRLIDELAEGLVEFSAKLEQPVAQ